MRCMLVGLGIGMTLMASGLKAQERLAPGDSVLVSYTVGDSGLPLFTAGSLHGVSQDSILMAVRSHGDTLSIPFYSLERLEVYRPANRGYLFATLGALVVGTLGAVAANRVPRCGQHCLLASDGERLFGLVVGGFLGGGAFGYGIGKHMKIRRAVRVPLADRRGWSIQPTVGSGIGFAATLKVN